jgi:glycosyltransferase involved in cell wall biosynthesis
MMKQRIGIDARLYEQTGVGVYLQNLLTWLHKSYMNRFEVSIFVQANLTKALQKQYPRFSILPTHAHWHSFAEQTTFLAEVSKQRLDLMHFTYFSYPALYQRPYVATVHDLTPLQYRTGKASTRSSFMYAIKYHCFRYVLSRQIKNARRIITPTETVKSQILETYPATDKTKIQAIYHGVHKHLLDQPENAELKTDYPPKSFFLYVGNVYPHKNIHSLIEAYHLGEISVPLIICTREDAFAKQLKQKVAAYNLQDIVHFYHNASDADLVYFYRHAKALIHPSLSEGFGLPLIEAMQFDLPVLASDIPVFHEVMGSLYVPFDQTEPQSIADAITSFIDNPTSFDYTAQKSLFSFEKMASETVSCYQQILDEIHA